MIKHRLKVWAVVLVLAFVANWVISSFPSWAKGLSREDVYLKVDVTNDLRFAESLVNYSAKGLRFKNSTSNPDIIISTSNEAKNGYNLYENYFYSPLVLYVRGNISNSGNDIGFIKVKSSQYKIDLLTIFEAMEDGLEWEDIGMDKDVVKGPVTLTIPNAQSPYYDKVEDLFYMTLNKGNMPDQDTRDRLRPRVIELINKCEVVQDIQRVVSQEYSSHSKNGRVIVGPEYFYYPGGSEFSSGSSYSSRPVYFTKTVYLCNNLYVKNDFQYAEALFNVFKTKKSFYTTTGWRVHDISYNVQDITSLLIENP